jgi:hypothetical protein
MKYCSTLYASGEASLDRKTRLFDCRNAFEAFREMASFYLDAPTQLIFYTGHATFS